MAEIVNGKRIFTKKTTKKNGSDSIDRDYRERAKREKERFDDAVSDEYWFCLCFSNTKELEKFRTRLDLSEKKFIGAREFQEAVKGFKPEKRLKTFASKSPKYPKVDNPFDGYPDDPNFEKDSCLTARLLLEAMKSANDGYSGSPIFSGIWICVVFGTQKQRDSFIADYNLGKRASFGNTYIDADNWLN